ncbi:MAG: ribonuclease Y [Candidatus Omnitrophica bacterium]|nr:ribonuclease Y [Candidatus Omnitrophota bacterium]HOX54710.1 ribonuclease Y [Candidatus Omnitrophota bacterium]
MFSLENIIVAMIFVIIAGSLIFIGYFYRKIFAEKKLQNAEAKVKDIIEVAKREAETKRKEAELEGKDLLYRIRQDFEKETKDRREELNGLEKRLMQKEENLERRVDLLERKEKELIKREEQVVAQEASIKNKDTQLQQLINEEKQRLQSISSLTRDEARNLLLSRMQDEVRDERAKLYKAMDDELREQAEKKAREVITLAIQRCATEHTVESTVSVVSLPNDEMKGRIIGREGRNIRALEMATGIDIIIDDTPEAITLAGFDVVRREVARLAIEKLISDGRIHPGRIEEIVEKAKKEMEQKIQEEGERAVFDMGIHRLHPELVKLLGKLRYRTSYGQNTLQHSKEVSYIMGVMASELGLDFKLARRVGLLHDIGKSVDQDVEGTHAKIGAELAKKFGETEEVIKAIEAHHEEVETSSLYGVLAIAADAISAARPGARRETLESYVKRLDKLESIAKDFKGVDKAFAIQAGREVRVIVIPDKVSDAEAAVLAADIRKKIEEGMEYPGQIKVTVIRETRVIEYAK